MQAAVAALQPEYQFALQLVDIDADELLRLRYNDKIPVLALGEQEICRYHLKQAELIAVLKQHAIS